MRKFIKYVKGIDLTPNTESLKVNGHQGTWYVISTRVHNDKTLFLLEHEYYGDEAAHLIVDTRCNIILDEAWNGFDDLDDIEE